MLARTDNAIAIAMKSSTKEYPGGRPESQRTSSTRFAEFDGNETRLLRTPDRTSVADMARRTHRHLQDERIQARQLIDRPAANVGGADRSGAGTQVPAECVNEIEISR